LVIDALGELASVAAGDIVSVAALEVLDPAAMPASAAVGAVAALSLDEFGIALELMSPCGAVVSPVAGAAVSPMVDCVADEDVSGCAIVDCALTAPGIIRAAAAKKSTLRMRLAPFLWLVSDHRTLGSRAALRLMR